jgi:peptidoglycan/xylan/chitin deacetylase (PgdA/CDA1 family)
VQADKRLVSIFNEYGIKGTFHLNSGLFGQPGRLPAAEIAAVYRGHEISCHTLTHPAIARCPLPYVARQVLEDRIALEAIAGYPVRGMSYPYGSYSEEIKAMLPALGIEYSRVVGDTDGFGLPADLLEWKSTCHHNHRLLENADAFLARAKSQHIDLLYVWGHSYEFDDDGNWGLITEFCKRVSRQESIWYATNIEITDYLNAVRQLRYSADMSFVYNPSAMDVWLSVDQNVVRVPGGAQINI